MLALGNTGLAVFLWEMGLSSKRRDARGLAATVEAGRNWLVGKSPRLSALTPKCTLDASPLKRV